MPRVTDPSPDLKPDTADFYHATIFSDSEYDGLGSWGDPDNDYQLCTGGFKDIVVAYPVPHHIRRNYTLYPNRPPGFLTPAGVPPQNPSLMYNTTFTSEVVDNTLSSTPGNYPNFQARLEAPPGPHPGPHFILGGDNAGTCPFGLGLSECVPGQKWSPNGEEAVINCFHRLINTRTDPMFFLHHGVCPTDDSIEGGADVLAV